MGRNFNNFPECWSHGAVMVRAFHSCEVVGGEQRSQLLVRVDIPPPTPQTHFQTARGATARTLISMFDARPRHCRACDTK
jgi:hypothetical protein